MAEIKELLKETRGKTTAVMVGVLLAALWLSQNFLWKPMNLKAAQLAAKIEEEKQKTALLESVILYDSKAAAAQKKLVTSPAYPVETISRLAKQMGIKVLALTPLEPVTEGAYQKIAVQMEGESTYHAIGKFLAAVESIEVPQAGVERISLSPTAHPETPDSPEPLLADTVRYSLHFVFFAPAPAQ